MQDLAILEPNAPLAVADSILPSFDIDDTLKRKYLSFKLTGFSRGEAAQLTGINLAIVKQWQSDDLDFKVFEQTATSGSYTKQIIKLEMARNLKLAMSRDSILLKKQLMNPDQLTPTEREYLKQIRPLYTPKEYAQLDSIFSADEAKGPQDWQQLIEQMAQIATQPKTISLTVNQNPQTINQISQGVINGQEKNNNSQVSSIEGEYQESSVEQNWLEGGEEEIEGLLDNAQ